MIGNLPNVYFAVVRSQAWVALCFTVLCYFFQFVNRIYNPQLLWLCFFATLVAYNLAYWFARKKELWRIPIIIISSILCLVFALQGLKPTSWILLIALGVVSILYTLPIKNKTLRKIPGLKIFWIASVWSLTLILPWLEIEDILWWRVIWQSLAVWCFVVGITIPFDIRDINLDDSDLHTIPQLMGIERSIRLATQMLMISAACFLISLNFEINEKSLAYLLTILGAIAMVRRSPNKHSKWFVSFWIEGMSFLPFLLYFILL